MAEASAAMREGRLDDAKTLAQLADTLGRVAAKTPPDTLAVVCEAALNPEYLSSLMDVRVDARPNPIKQRFWREWSRPHLQMKRQREEIERLCRELETLRVRRAAPG